MADIFSALFEVLGISLVGLALAGWYSVGMLEVFSLRVRQFHDWAQLRLHARRVGLTAYRDAHAEAIREGASVHDSRVAGAPRAMVGAAEGMQAESY